MMGQIAVAVLLVASISPAQVASGQPAPQSSSQVNAAQPVGLIVIPRGTPVDLAVTSPLWTKTAKPGDAVYAQTIFPVVVNGQMAVPPGTYVAGRIDSLTRPGLFSPHASLQISFDKIVFANGYAITLPNAPVNVRVPPDVIPAVAAAYVQVSRASTVLLDNGSQLRMIIQLPVALDAGRVASAVQKRKSPEATLSAVVCRPTPGTPGTPGHRDSRHARSARDSGHRHPGRARSARHRYPGNPGHLGNARYCYPRHSGNPRNGMPSTSGGRSP